MRKKLDSLGGVGAQGKGLEEGGGLTEGLGIYYLQGWHITNFTGTPVWLIMGTFYENIPLSFCGGFTEELFNPHVVDVLMLSGMNYR